MNVAFLGLGTMGAPMAANVLARGHALTVWNRTASRADALVAKGAALAATPGDAAAGAEVVILMLADPRAVDAVLDGVLEKLPPGAIVIDMSTVDPATARRSDERVRARGGRFLDAPVSGTRKPAVDGTLLIMAAGPADALERARPVLEAMGRVLHVGAVGQGMAMKLILNGLGAHMITAFGAMLAFGVKQGLDPRAMLDVIGGGAFSSPLYKAKGERILARDFHADFTLALTLKDQELVLATARSLGVELPTLEAVRAQLADAVAAGLGGDDLCGIVQLFERRAGVTVE
ncbi:MAG TPA: NAD(P)-dependent oxidoreductase [Polyangia bacterium]|nr:NAD(P)-dependent oxidoreductase [Polyangia bacterium]